MCRSFALFSNLIALMEYVQLSDELDDYTPSYNITPGQSTPVVTLEGGEPHLRSMRWGMVPAWAAHTDIGDKLYNARSETAPDKPAFRLAWSHRRCLVPANGFYEFQRGRRPWHIRLADRELFCFAGLWECWDKGDEPLYSFSILTCNPNDTVARVHNRMPVVLPAQAESEWLYSGSQSLMRPYGGPMESWRVPRLVNDAENDGPELLSKLDEQAEISLFS